MGTQSLPLSTVLNAKFACHVGILERSISSSFCWPIQRFAEHEAADGHPLAEVRRLHLRVARQFRRAAFGYDASLCQDIAVVRDVKRLPDVLFD